MKKENDVEKVEETCSTINNNSNTTNIDNTSVYKPTWINKEAPLKKEYDNAFFFFFAKDVNNKGAENFALFPDHNTF